MWSEKDFAWWNKGRKGKKGLSKGNDGFQKGGFRPYQPDKGAVKDYSENKGNGRFQKGKGKEEAPPQSGLSASETPEEEGYSHAWESDDWSGALMILGLKLQDGFARELILLGWRNLL